MKGIRDSRFTMQDSRRGYRASCIMYHVSFLFFTFCFLLVTASGTYAGEPTDQMKQTIDSVLDILKNKELKKPEKTKERRAVIHKVVGSRFDFEEMSKRSLALHWRARSSEEKGEFVALFSDLLERSYIKKIESYEDEQILYTGETIDGDYAVVKTKIITKRNVEIPVEYRLMKKNAKFEVYDVVIEGVSLVSNYRNQFNRIIRTSSYAELLKRMKSKQEEELFVETR
ncbi:MAG: ABC transporter substrate-binding protein [Nitrospirota bacterium]